MKSINIKKLYMLHSWVGLVTGILLFVIAFTGAISVFGRPELKVWANPEIREGIAVDAAQIEQVIKQHAKDLPYNFKQEILVFLPGARSYPNLRVMFEDHENQQAVLLSFDNQTLEVLERKEGSPREVFEGRKIDIADFIVDFHADLHLGRPVGLLITGLLGLTLMASIITGFVIHRQKLKQLFTFRRKKSLDTGLADSHKAFGVWGLIFHGVIAFTGAFLGLATVLLVPAAAFVSFNGDQEKLIETFTTTPEPIAAQVYKPTQIAPALNHAFEMDDDMTVEVMTVYAYDDQNAVIYISAIGSDRVARQLLEYKGSTGEFVDAFGQFGKVGGFSAVVLDLMFPLHFGNFGGVLVKFIWTILGLSTALLPLSGMMLWIERGQRAIDPKHSKAAYERFNRLVIGSCGGIVLACAALFPTQLILYSLGSVTQTGFLIGCVFFSLWLISTIFAFATNTARQAARILAFTTSLTLILTVPLNIMLTSHNPISLLIDQHWVAATVDLSLIFVGLLILIITLKLSKKTSKPNVEEELFAPLTNKHGESL